MLTHFPLKLQLARAHAQCGTHQLQGTRTSMAPAAFFSMARTPILLRVRSMHGDQTVVEAAEEMSVGELLTSLVHKTPPAAMEDSPLYCNGRHLAIMENSLRWYGIRDNMKVAVQMLPGLDRPKGTQKRKRLNRQAEREAARITQNVRLSREKHGDADNEGSRRPWQMKTSTMKTKEEGQQSCRRSRVKMGKCLPKGGRIWQHAK